MIARIVPGLLLGSLAGVIADRLDRKWVMVLSDAGRGVVVLAFVLADDLVTIAIISALLEILTMIRQPAREAAVPTLVAPNDLVKANSLSAAAAYGTAPLGAAAWAALAALFSRHRRPGSRSTGVRTWPSAWTRSPSWSPVG